MFAACGLACFSTDLMVLADHWAVTTDRLVLIRSVDKLISWINTIQKLLVVA